MENKDFLNENIEALLEARRKRYKVRHTVNGKTVSSEEAYEAENVNTAEDMLDSVRKSRKARAERKKEGLTENYTDSQLLDFLEENNFEVSYSNLCILREGLINGSIVLEAKKEEIEAEEAPEEPVEEVTEDSVETQEEAPIEDAAPRISISMPVDGSMQIDNQGKQIVADAEGNVQVALAENKNFRMLKDTERFLKSYLTEDCEMEEKEYQMLREEVKVESVKDIAIELLKAVEEKLNSIDTTPADRSRGDIKQLKELSVIQNSLTQLEALLERDNNSCPEYKTAVSTVIKSILFLNQYSYVFKDAYRNKKTVMILKYQSLILSIISSISYILSVIVDYKSDTIKLKSIKQDINEFAPLKSLDQFVKSVDSGEFKKVINDVNILREYYLEVPVETMSNILEASEYLPMIINGVENIYNSLTSGEIGNKISNFLYKAIGILVLLFSLRDTLYTIFRMKSKVSDMNNMIQNFSNVNNGGNILSKISQFANKFKTDAEYSSDLSKREIEDENRKILNQVKTVQSNSIIDNDNFKPEEEFVSNNDIESSSNLDFGLDF